MSVEKSFLNKRSVPVHVYLLYQQPCTNGLHQPNQHLTVFLSCVIEEREKERVQMIALILFLEGRVWDVTL